MKAAVASFCTNYIVNPYQAAAKKCPLLGQVGSRIYALGVAIINNVCWAADKVWNGSRNCCCKQKQDLTPQEQNIEKQKEKNLPKPSPKKPSRGESLFKHDDQHKNDIVNMMTVPERNALRKLFKDEFNLDTLPIVSSWVMNIEQDFLGLKLPSVCLLKRKAGKELPFAAIPVNDGKQNCYITIGRTTYGEWVIRTTGERIFENMDNAILNERTGELYKHPNVTAISGLLQQGTPIKAPGGRLWHYGLLK